MGISRAMLMKYVEKPEFSTVIDMLIDAGLLAGKWTADDLLRALEQYETRLEIVSLFCDLPANDQLEEAFYQSQLRRSAPDPERRALKALLKRKWRKDPENTLRERKSDKRRHARHTRKRRLKRAKEHREFLSCQRNETKAKLKSRLAPLRKTQPTPCCLAVG